MRRIAHVAFSERLRSMIIMGFGFHSRGRLCHTIDANPKTISEYTA
jgi:hypothetical protein